MSSNKEKLQSKKIILIDGHSLLYRAFYALPPTLATSSGQITNAAYGFTSMLIKLIKEVNPDFIAVAFDKGPVTFRHKIFSDYKAHRPETPDDLISQISLVKSVLEALQIPIFELEGYEADDILGTLAQGAEKEDSEIFVVTGDKDALQLISPQVKIMTTRKGISDIVVYDQKKLEEKYGIGPKNIKDLLALKGDSSDNIPGVPGIGEKTATKLIKEFGSLEEVLDNAAQVKGSRIKKALEDYADQARLSKELATLECNLPLKVHLEEFPVGKWDWEQVKEVFSALEFNTLLKRLKELDSSCVEGKSRLGKVPDETDSTFFKTPFDVKVEVVKDEATLDKLVRVLSSSVVGKVERRGEVGLEVETHNERLKGLTLYFRDTSYHLPLESPSSSTSKYNGESKLKLGKIKPLMESSDLKKVVHNGKAKILSLRREGINLTGLSFDTQIAAYLLQPSRAGYSLSKLAWEYLQVDLDENGAEEKKYLKNTKRAVLCLKLKKVLEKELKKEGLWDLFNNIEMPLVPILAEMEQIGVGIDVGKLDELSLELEKLLDKSEEKIFYYAREEFNINSPQQLGAILFDKLGLKSQKRTKTGYSTDSSVLYKLTNQHPIIENIINYRELSKLKSTYVDALPRLINPRTGRLHTSFNQVGTATGRLSSSNPNLQNIPIRTEIGSRIREAFVPARSSDELLVVDYSQIELRILAHFSSDKNLTKAFEEEKDIHRATASEVFEVEQDKVTPQMRRAAKAVNFGIVYGISPHGLSEQLGIGKAEAKSYIERYFSRYPKTREFIEKAIAKAYNNGFVTTLLGRKRFLPELKSGNLRRRNLGERLAVNTTIQGSAADLMKLAMVNLARKFEGEGFQSRMVLQVHDELIFEVPVLERIFLADVVKEIMENVYALRPQLVVNISWGRNWLDAK